MMSMTNIAPLNTPSSKRSEGLNPMTQLVDKSGRFNRLQRSFQNQLKGLAREFYKTYQEPLILTDTLRTNAEQAKAHQEKPTLALPAGHPNAMHPRGLAVDVDQSQANLITPGMLAHNGLCLPALYKGETWHVEPISKPAGGYNPSSYSVSLANFQPLSSAGSRARLSSGASKFKQQCQRLAATSPLMKQGLTAQGTPTDRRLQQAAQEVEAIFLEQLLGQMRTALVDPISPTHRKLRGYQSLADQQLARSLAAGGGLGLAARIMKDLAPVDSHPYMENRHDGDTPVPGKTGAPAETQSV